MPRLALELLDHLGPSTWMLHLANSGRLVNTDALLPTVNITDSINIQLFYVCIYIYIYYMIGAFGRRLVMNGKQSAGAWWVQPEALSLAKELQDNPEVCIWDRPWHAGSTLFMHMGFGSQDSGSLFKSFQVRPCRT